MKRLVLLALLNLMLINAFGQCTVKGIVIDKSNNEPLAYVNVKITQDGQQKMLKGGLTDTEGGFAIGGLRYGKYQVQLSFVGFKTITRTVTFQKGRETANVGKIFMIDDSNLLSEVTVTGQKSAIKLEVDRKSYDVSQDLSNVGASASEALENIPSVEVDNDGNISLRGSSSVEVWINGKASGLTSDNRATILQQIPAESIERIEVIDNPSAKFSAEGSAGIINIILKKDRKAGYYGSLQGGFNTYGGAEASVNLNVNSKLIDAYATVGYRHREDEQQSLSEQDIMSHGVLSSYQNNDTKSTQRGNGIFTRFGATLHATDKDDFTLSGMLIFGKHHNGSESPYQYGTYNGGNKLLPELDRILTRYTSGEAKMRMKHFEFGYRHNFSDTHFLDLNLSHGIWSMDNETYYQDRTIYADGVTPKKESWQYRPSRIRPKNTELKLDYENKISEIVLLQLGYNLKLNRENTPQEAWSSDDFYGIDAVVDEAYYNRFIYKQDTHAGYATVSMKFGKFGVMGGLRGEYWKVNTESYNYDQEYRGALRDNAYKKDFFKLFPSLFVTYQLTERDQLQVNYTRRLRRPWGGELNSFMDTRQATSVSYGNPELTPEYSNSFAFNYLRTWDDHSMLLSAFYRPTTDVIQRVRYRIDGDDRMFSTNMNLAESVNSGLELTLKNKFWKILDLSTTASAFYYKLDGFDYDTMDPLYNKPIHVSGESDSRFSWNARIQASVMLPWEMSFQVKGNYRSRQVISQGVRKAGYGIDLGFRKSFMNKKFIIAVNCRDLLDSRQWVTETWGEDFEQYSKNRRHARKFNVTLTYTFGNNKRKGRPGEEYGGPEEDATTTYSGGGED